MTIVPGVHSVVSRLPKPGYYVAHVAIDSTYVYPTAVFAPDGSLFIGTNSTTPHFISFSPNGDLRGCADVSDGQYSAFINRSLAATNTALYADVSYVGTTKNIAKLSTDLATSSSTIWLTEQNTEATRVIIDPYYDPATIIAVRRDSSNNIRLIRCLISTSALYGYSPSGIAFERPQGLAINSSYIFVNRAVFSHSTLGFVRFLTLSNFTPTRVAAASDGSVYLAGLSNATLYITKINSALDTIVWQKSLTGIGGSSGTFTELGLDANDNPILAYAPTEGAVKVFKLSATDGSHVLSLESNCGEPYFGVAFSSTKIAFLRPSYSAARGTRLDVLVVPIDGSITGAPDGTISCTSISAPTVNTESGTLSDPAETSVDPAGTIGTSSVTPTPLSRVVTVSPIYNSATHG